MLFGSKLSTLERPKRLLSQLGLGTIQDGPPKVDPTEKAFVPTGIPLEAQDPPTEYWGDAPFGAQMGVLVLVLVL